MAFANLLSSNLLFFGIVFSAIIDAIIISGALNGKVSHGNIEKLSLPLSLFILVLLIYKAAIWTI